MSTIRVALVASTFGVGGAERLTANVLERLPSDRFEIRLYFLHGAGAVGRSLFERGFEGGERLCKRAGDPCGGARLFARFRDYRPHVVFCMDHHDAMLLGRTAGILARARASVVASHSTAHLGRDGSPRRSFEGRDRLLMEFTARVVAVSRTHARYLREREGIDPGRIVVIENGIDPAAWPPAAPENRARERAALGIAPDEAVVAMIAAFRPEKAHEVLFEALALLARRGRRVRALLAGDGERRPFLEARAESLGVRDRVDFLGVRDDVARVLHACDMAVLPSRAVVETFPLAVLEAMETGVPVIASRVGSVPEVVEDGVTGWLIAPAAPLELAARIEHILDEPMEAGRVALRGRELVSRRYSIERTAAGYMEMLGEVAAA